jgi:ATP-dependent DNA helicase RecQ
VFRQLVALGLVRIDLENHSVVKLGEPGRVLPVLRAETSVPLRRDPERIGRRKKATRQGRTSAAFRDLDLALFEALRALRLEIALEQEVPAYVVFNDATLVELVRRRPASHSEFAEVPGVGKSKLERYGTPFLDVIAKAAASPGPPEGSDPAQDP